jgi:hypothetical protein
MKAMIAAFLVATAAVPATAQSLQSAEGDWSSVPRLKFSDVQLLGVDTIVHLQKLVTSGQCQLPGVSRRKVDMTVPFLVRFAPSGKVQDVVVRKLGCPRAESILASAILELVKAGTFKGTGENMTGWYQSELSFSYS